MPIVILSDRFPFMNVHSRTLKTVILGEFHAIWCHIIRYALYLCHMKVQKSFRYLLPTYLGKENLMCPSRMYARKT